MKIAQEEIFGPVLSVMRFKDIDEVVERANSTDLRPGRGGLDPRHQQGPLVANKIQAGTVWINCYDVLRRRPRRSAASSSPASAASWAKRASTPTPS